METVAIQKYEEQGGELLTQAHSIKIVDGATRELAAAFTVKTRKAVKVIEAEFRPDIEKAHTLHKDLLTRLKKLIAPFTEARHVVDGEISRDYFEQEKARREEERIAQAKADKERREQEAQLAEEAEELIEEGDMEGAEALLDSEVVVNPDVPVAPVEKTTRSDAGSATVRKDIAVEVTDKQAVLEAVVAHTLPDTLVTVDVGAAKRYVKASGLMTMPGFRIMETVVVSGRTR